MTKSHEDVQASAQTSLGRQPWLEKTVIVYLRERMQQPCITTNPKKRNVTSPKEIRKHARRPEKPQVKVQKHKRHCASVTPKITVENRATKPVENPLGSRRHQPAVHQGNECKKGWEPLAEEDTK